jgi:glycosyltransferase involved in cell wall biosynthesis
VNSVLLVTYDFPPAGGVGVQRVAKFAKYLSRLGWRVSVLTTRHGRSGPRDPSLLDELADIQVHRTLAPDPFRALSAMSSPRSAKGQHPTRLHGDTLSLWHPAAWIVPDAKLPWVPFGVDWALGSDRERCDVVVSTLPTPTAAVLGSMIARLWRVPHVIDYRDPWTGGFYLPPRAEWLRRLELAWERRILRGANAAVIVPGVREHLPPVDTPVTVIHNGYDEDDFVDNQPRRPADADFVIAHVGILWKKRDLASLLSALDSLTRRLPDLGRRVHLLQIGQVDGHVAHQLETASSRMRVTSLPYVPHREAIAYMLGADVLYLPTSHDGLPGKTYEYLRSGTPILGLAAPGSHLDRLLAETGGGEVIGHMNVERIATFIEQVMTDPAASRAADASILRDFSREMTTVELAEVLREIIATSGGRKT